MKKLKELKKIHNIFVDSVTELDIKMQLQMKQIKQEYQQNVTEEKIRLLVAICNGEGLDFDTIKNKYLKSKELILVKSTKQDVESVVTEEEMLDKIEINRTQYYYEPKEKGVIYNSNSKPVGIYKNGEFILH